jgi:hypothetical protein
MNNEGVKLKSEAIIASKMSMPIVPERFKPKIYFNDTFVMFLQKTIKTNLFCIAVKDVR